MRGIVTLVVQAITLRPLLVWLDVRDDGTVEREVQLARVETLRASLTAIAACGGGEGSELFRRRYELRLHRVERHEDEIDPADPEVVRVATDAERHRLIELRETGTIGDAAFQQVEQEMDIKELGMV